ncbi:MFS transporter [Corynebacterium lowii]|uniref:L-galactonate transporter n=1 Tax=Corynebacterium lowii TaxID=1544413 RepID=A0A0N8W0I8_9CORY|nr:MFS transporter [Corynebacterium lowii]KQB86818.1 L-galactonate transporter [Corynebacterium lowii]MDP9851505.1 nitrate/nitrite transporter NarK [Corynebacterium lowii]
MTAPQPTSPERLSRQALLVWASAVCVYIVAITGRTSFGVAGTEAMSRFDVSAGRIAVFTSVQVGVYALVQIPTGIAIDRYGPRRLLALGALIMAVGQITLALTTSYPVALLARVLIGAGDATAFLSAMRILPYWFPLRRAPLFAQLTGSLGQIGQFLSAVPFLALLHGMGWTPAFLSLGALGVLVALLAWIAVIDAPSAPSAPPQSGSPSSLANTLRRVTTSPVCWLGFFTHWTGIAAQVTFTLL